MASREGRDGRKGWTAEWHHEASHVGWLFGFKFTFASIAIFA